MGDTSVIELLIKVKDALSDPMKKMGKQTKRLESQFKQFEKSTKHFKSLFYAGVAFEGMAWGVGEVLKHLAEPALEFDEAQRDLARATGRSVTSLGKFKEQAMELSEVLPRSAADVTVAQADLVRTLGSTAAAIKTAGIAMQFSEATGLDAKASADLLGTTYESLGDKTKPLTVGFQEIADKLTVLQSKYSLSRDNGELLVRSMAHVAAAASLMGTNVDEAMAATAVLNKSGFGGGRGAGAYVEQLLEQMGKLDKDGFLEMMKYGIRPAGSVDRSGHFHLDLMQTLHNMMRAQGPRLDAYLKSLGSQGGMLRMLLDRYGQLTEAMHQLQNAQGATKQTSDRMNRDWKAQLKELSNTYHNLEQSLGEVLVPMLIELGHAIEPAIDGFRKFIEAHKWVAKIGMVLLMVTFAGLLLTGTTLILTSAFGGLWSALKLGLVLMKEFEIMSKIIDILMLENPIGAIIVGIVAAGIALYELIHHWQAVKRFFTEGWGRFTGLGLIIMMVEKLIQILPLVRAWGAHFIDAIVAGIKSGIHKLGHAMHKVAAVIRSYLPFSPAERGPLRDLPKTRIVQTIAQTLRPALLVPALAAAQLAPAAGMGSQSAPVEVHLHVHMEGGAHGDNQAAVDGMLDTLEANKDKFAGVIGDIMDRAHGNWNRTGF